VLFTITLPSNTAAGLYPVTFEILGGADSGAQDTIASVRDFPVNVASTFSTVPEPESLMLLAAGLPGVALLAQKKWRRIRLREVQMHSAPIRQETRLELLWVHEADRDSGMVEYAHHLARHIVCDDWALCAAAAEEIAEVTDFIVEPGGFKGLVKFHGASIDVPDGRMDRVPPLARDCDIS
jgi:hypothetical protein